MFDALFSLSFLSLFLVPFMSSYSTSLNFLFFWMTWSTLIFSHSALKVEMIGTIVVRLLCFGLPSTLMYLFDVIAPSVAVVIKSQGEAGLPGGRRQRNLKLKHFQVAGWSLLNMFLGLFVQALIEIIFVKVLRWRSALKISSRLPMPGSIIKHLLCGIILRGVRELPQSFFCLSSRWNKNQTSKYLANVSFLRYCHMWRIATHCTIRALQ